MQDTKIQDIKQIQNKDQNNLTYQFNTYNASTDDN